MRERAIFGSTAEVTQIWCSRSLLQRGPERIQRYGRVPPFAETIFLCAPRERGYENNKASTLKKRAARAETLPPLPARTDQAQ